MMIKVRNIPIYKVLQYCKTNLSTLLCCPFLEDKLPGTSFLGFTKCVCVKIKRCETS